MANNVATYESNTQNAPSQRIETRTLSGVDRLSFMFSDQQMFVYTMKTFATWFIALLLGTLMVSYLNNRSN